MDEITKEKIYLEISKIDNLVSKSTALIEKCKIQEPDFFELNAMGSILHSYYNGLESIFKLIYKSSEEKPLTSNVWHSELFQSMFEKSENRETVLSQDLKEPLKEYLGFRHVFRHSYGYELDWERLNPLFCGMSAPCNRLSLLCISAELRSWQVPCAESIDERSEEPTFMHRVPAKAIPQIVAVAWGTVVAL